MDEPYGHDGRVATPERYEVPPDRLERWLVRWAERHGRVARTEVASDAVTFWAADGARLRAEPPLAPLADLARGQRTGFCPAPLLDHVALERTVGVLLVRLGGCAAGVFTTNGLVDSKVDRRLVHSRHRAGGSSQRRFARRRDNEAQAALTLAANVAARVLAPPAAAGGLDAVVRGGDGRACDEVLADPRLAALVPLVRGRMLDVPDPRLDVLRAMPARFLATVLWPCDAAPAAAAPEPG
jgi:hypothetical protein